MGNFKKVLVSGGGDEVPKSQSIFVIPGTHSWTCPDGVTSVSVVCVGGGGGANHASGGTGYKIGGGGGALAYKNNISVTPGSSYTVVVGKGGLNGYTYDNYASQKTAGEDGGNSYFWGTNIVNANGGKGGPLGNYYSGYPNAAATYTGDGGGNGGRSGIAYSGSYAGKVGGGGGGAGGYSGAGGTTGSFNGYGSANGNLPTAPSGGGGAYGGTNSTSGSGGGGGGVGIFGAGSSGTVPSGHGNATGVFKGGGGSGGQDGEELLEIISYAYSLSGIGAMGGLFGGGGGVKRNSQYQDVLSGRGGGGCVRIVWPGNERQFPSTDVGNY